MDLSPVLPRRRFASAAGGVALALLLVPALAPAAVGQTQTYEPQVGQPGKDVVWVPTGQALVEKMLDIAKVTPQDYLIDLGSGDGRTVIAAARRGLTAHGIEYNPDMVELAKTRAAEAGLADRATFEKADLFESDFSRATVITMFLLPSINEKLRPKILDLEPGTRIVSNTFTMGEWRADETATVEEDCTSWCTALLWIVPAKVEGVWRLGDKDMKLTQEFQMLSGTLGEESLSDARLNGREISFTAGGVRYAGNVDGDRMKGVRIGRPGESWTAARN
jgi:SAM-dependent methyltransferase